MKKLSVFVLIILVFSNCFICSGQIYHEKSKYDNYAINIYTSMKYKTEVFGNPFGDFLEDAEDGWMVNEQGVKGEYKYLGYNYKEEKITNDRYFSKLGKRGKVFDKDYTNVEWQDVLPDALMSWESIRNDNSLLMYILTTNFYDEDHPTKGITDTGFNLLKLFKIPEGSTDYSEIFRKAVVLTTPRRVPDMSDWYTTIQTGIQ